MKLAPSFPIPICKIFSPENLTAYPVTHLLAHGRRRRRRNRSRRRSRPCFRFRSLCLNVFPCDRGKGNVASIVTCFQCGKFFTPSKSSVRIEQSIVIVLHTTSTSVSDTLAYSYMTCKRGQTDQHSHYGQQREDQQMHSQSAHRAVSRFQLADICLPLRGRRNACGDSRFFRVPTRLTRYLHGKPCMAFQRQNRVFLSICGNPYRVVAPIARGPKRGLPGDIERTRAPGKSIHYRYVICMSFGENVMPVSYQFGDSQEAAHIPAQTDRGGSAVLREDDRR